MDIFLLWAVSFAAGYGVGIWFGRMRPHWGWASRIGFGLAVVFVICAVYAVAFDAPFPAPGRPFVGVGSAACMWGLGWNNKKQKKP